MTTETLIIPTIHMNGTSADSLVEGYLDAFNALDNARLRLMETYPNGRDYYVQTKGWTNDEDGAYVKAREQHEARVAGVIKAMDDLQTLAAGVINQK